MANTFYFDYAAATPMDSTVQAAMLPYYEKQFYNPSALYMPARATKAAVEAARAKVARIIGSKHTEIVFTAGATESINLAIRGLSYKKTDEIIISSIEHEAVMAAANSAGAKVRICPVGYGGMVNLEALAKLINPNTRLVSIGQANNEIGVIQPMAKISRIIKNINKDVLLHTDASQAANYLSLQVSRLGVDLMTLNGGKIYGPKQTGCLYIKSGVDIKPQIVGGGQERGLRSGTENVAGSVGLAKALEIAQAKKIHESQRLLELRNLLQSEIQSKLKGTKVNGNIKKRLPNSLNITIAGVSGESLVYHLDQMGILVATGAACSANKETPSHVLKALGLSTEEINSSLRITLGRQTTKKAVGYLVEKLAIAAKQLRGL